MLKVVLKVAKQRSIKQQRSSSFCQETCLNFFKHFGSNHLTESRERRCMARCYIAGQLGPGY